MGRSSSKAVRSSLVVGRQKSASAARCFMPVQRIPSNSDLKKSKRQHASLPVLYVNLRICFSELRSVRIINFVLWGMAVTKELTISSWDILVVSYCTFVQCLLMILFIILWAPLSLLVVVAVAHIQCEHYTRWCQLLCAYCCWATPKRRAISAVPLASAQTSVSHRWVGQT